MPTRYAADDGGSSPATGEQLLVSLSSHLSLSLSLSRARARSSSHSQDFSSSAKWLLIFCVCWLVMAPCLLPCLLHCLYTLIADALSSSASVVQMHAGSVRGEGWSQHFAQVRRESLARRRAERERARRALPKVRGPGVQRLELPARRTPVSWAEPLGVINHRLVLVDAHRVVHGRTPAEFTAHQITTRRAYQTLALEAVVCDFGHAVVRLGSPARCLAHFCEVGERPSKRPLRAR